MDAEQAAQVVPLLKALADPVRLRLMSMVLSHENAEACVCDLMPAFDLSQPTISHHLKVLHESGLLNREKRGVWVYYQARPAAMEAMVTLFTTAGLSLPEAAQPVGVGG
jgi:ArsR family transcriptional regulator